MRQLIEGLQHSLSEFIEQCDDLIMIVACSDNDAAIALKLAENLEQSSPSDAFLLFADDFCSFEQYVTVTLDRLQEQVNLANDWLQEQQRQPLPPFPEHLRNSEISPIRCLGEAMMYARSLVSHDGGQRLVWIMFPQRIADRRAYLEFVSGFAPRRGIHSGMQGLRLVFRDEPGTERFFPELARLPRVRLSSIDIGPDAIAQALKDEAENTALPDEQRMQALLQHAFLDAAHGRAYDALVQFKILLGYYQGTNNPLLQAVVLTGAADVYRRQNQTELARHWYECALTPAIEAGSPVALHTPVSNLADMAFERGELDQAAQLYEYADQLAGKMLYSEGMMYARTRRAECQEKLLDWQGAAATWLAASNLSRNACLTSSRAYALERLSDVYDRLGLAAEAQTIRQELEAFRQEAVLS